MQIEKHETECRYLKVENPCLYVNKMTGTLEKQQFITPPKKKFREGKKGQHVLDLVHNAVGACTLWPTAIIYRQNDFFYVWYFMTNSTDKNFILDVLYLTTLRKLGTVWLKLLLQCSI